MCVIVDEAYCEFSVLDDPDASIDLLDRPPEPRAAADLLQGVRACGLRAGYALCGSEAFRMAVDQVRQPFFANAPAQAAAVEALRHQDEVARRVEQTIAARLVLEEGLRELGLAPSESQTNFVWFALPEEADEAAVVAALGRAQGRSSAPAAPWAASGACA